MPCRNIRAIVAFPFVAFLLPALTNAQPVATPDLRPVVDSYVELSFRAYRDAYLAALNLQKAVDEFVTSPHADPQAALALVREAWLASRPAYGRTEALRFYEGPIDFGRRPDGTQGPEPRINAWPLNEAYIDYVQGNPRAGLVNEPDATITRASLIEHNARDDEADVTTGFHAIEFLLWGQDLDPDGPGDRPASDFQGDGAAARRRAYLKAATDLLVDDLKYVVDQWAPDAANYRASFVALDTRESAAHILTGLATLAGFEVAAERLATPLDSGSQEDEHSCFSDSTHLDILANVTGIAAAYFGRAQDFQGVGIDTAIAAVNPEIAARIDEQLATSLKLARSMDRPFDRTLATPPGSPQRAKVEALITSLQTLARLFKLGGQLLGVNIVVTVEIEH
jgi:putative iron-regulated protein